MTNLVKFGLTFVFFFFFFLDRLASPIETLTKIHHGPGNRTSSTLIEIEYKNSSDPKARVDETPTLRIKHDIFNEDQLDTVYKFHQDIGQFADGNHTLSELGMIATTVNLHTVRFNELFMHRYDSLAELEESFGPQVNGQQCLEQLEQLDARAEQLKRQKFGSRDANLYRILDTFGRVQPGMIADTSRWTGMHDECLKLKIDLAAGGQRAPTRYCLASLRHRNWPRETKFQRLVAVEVGVCLPKACDSFRYKNKYDLISKLIEFNLRQMDELEATLESLYCLPDDDSPMRMWWRLPRVVLALVLIVGWLLFLVHATIKYERFKDLTHFKRHEPIGAHMPIGSNVDGHSAGQQPMAAKGSQNLSPNNAGLKFYQMFSVSHNVKILFGMETTGERGKQIAGEQGGRSSTDGQDLLQTKEAKSTRKIVDLRCMDGIKVITMFGFVLSHVLMTLSDTVTNGGYIKSFSSISMFSVNTFFTMTGILNCYLIFLKNQTCGLIENPIKWTLLIIYRYFRIMTVYVVVVYYTKYFSKFTASGPLWDYGTSSLAHRRQCEQESWFRTLLFGSNFKRLVENCNMSGWYVANDFQFFLVTPMLLLALLKSPTFGKISLKVCMLAGWLASIYKTMSSDEPDLRAIVKNMPHTFAVHSVAINEEYMEPQYRIPAYLCGLLFGYHLYAYEQGQLHGLTGTSTEPTKAKNGSHDRCKHQVEAQQTLDWPRWFTGYGVELSFLIVLTPAILAQFPRNPLLSGKFVSKILAATILPTYHILFAIASGSYILLASTGHGAKYLNNFLSAPFWKPLARLSLCVALVNIDIIFYMKEARKFHGHIEFIEQFSLNLLAIFLSYLVAFVVYILFEAPVASAIKYFLFEVLVKKKTAP